MNSTFAQSKKEQIEILKMRTDSLTNVIDNERKINFIKMQELNSVIEIKKNQINSLHTELKKISDNFNQKELETIQLKNKINAKSIEIDDLRHQLKNKSDSLKILAVEFKRIKEAIKIKNNSNQIEDLQYKVAKSFNPLDYDFEYYDFNQNYDTVIIKEKTRILNSNYAKRDLSLKVKLLTGETISLISINEHEGNAQTHFTYLFENELRAKLYYVMINYYEPGPGTKSYTLIEIDLKTGKKNTLVSNIGSNFNFNKNQTYLIVSGWYDSQDYLNDNQLQVINIVNKKIDLVVKDVEPININWLSEYEFQCQLLKYSKVTDPDGEGYEVPSVDRSGNFNKFKFNNGLWSKQ